MASFLGILTTVRPGEIICELKGMVFLVLQPSWSLKEKPGRFLEGKKEQSGPRTGPWTLLGGKKTIVRIKKNGPNIILKESEEGKVEIATKIDAYFFFYFGVITSVEKRQEPQLKMGMVCHCRSGTRRTESF